VLAFNLSRIYIDLRICIGSLAIGLFYEFHYTILSSIRERFPDYYLYMIAANPVAFFHPLRAGDLILV